MYVRIEVDGISDIYEKLDLGMDAEAILEKIFEAEDSHPNIVRKADEAIENNFYRYKPDDWEVDEYICEQLLDDMGMTMEDLDRMVEDEEGE